MQVILDEEADDLQDQSCTPKAFSEGIDSTLAFCCEKGLCDTADNCAI